MMTTMIETLARKLGKEYNVDESACMNAALALIEDVSLACADKRILGRPEVARFVEGYGNPVFLRLGFNHPEKRYEGKGIFASYEEAAEKDEFGEYVADHIHHVVRDEGTSVRIFVMENLNIQDEYDEIPRISTRVLPEDETMRWPASNEDCDVYPVLVKGLRVVPSLRQMEGMHPIDPRFYIREV